MSMTKDQIERCDALWRELLAAERVRWIDGMLARADGWEPLRLVAELVPSGWSGVAVWTDPATIGCLVSLAREATGDAEASCMFYGGRWYCHWHANETIAETETEALLLAIKEAAR
jgi:hypothetical protein